MTDEGCLSGGLIGVKPPPLPLVFLDHLAYPVVVADLYALPFFQLGFTFEPIQILSDRSIDFE
jgi:hypothetical protein